MFVHVFMYAHVFVFVCMLYQLFQTDVKIKIMTFFLQTRKSSCHPNTSVPNGFSLWLAKLGACISIVG
jgi:hypothetical protein